MYVRPLYLKAESGKIPELKRVVVAYDNAIAMAGTLEEGLTKIFGTGSKVPEGSGEAKTTTTPAGVSGERIREAVAAYEQAIQAQKNGDWAGYGEAIKRLGDILKQ
jgi:uncharacterized membrane protein (UPF0182 family)